MKKCKICGIDFIQKDKRQGLLCDIDYLEENNKYNKKNYLLNKEYKKQYSREYYHKNKERIIQRKSIIQKNNNLKNKVMWEQQSDEEQFNNMWKFVLEQLK